MYFQEYLGCFPTFFTCKVVCLILSSSLHILQRAWGRFQFCHLVQFGTCGQMIISFHAFLLRYSILGHSWSHIPVLLWRHNTSPRFRGRSKSSIPIFFISFLLSLSSFLQIRMDSSIFRKEKENQNFSPLKKTKNKNWYQDVQIYEFRRTFFFLNLLKIDFEIFVNIKRTDIVYCIGTDPRNL